MVYNCANILKQPRVLHKSKFSIVEWANAEQKGRYAQSVAISDVICALFEVGVPFGAQTCSLGPTFICGHSSIVVHLSFTGPHAAPGTV